MSQVQKFDDQEDSRESSNPLLSFIDLTHFNSLPFQSFCRKELAKGNIAWKVKLYMEKSFMLTRL